ncbi:lysine exporter LysO family protein [Thermococcus sp.]
MRWYGLLVLLVLGLGFLIGRLAHPNLGDAYELVLYILVFLIGLDIGMEPVLPGSRRAQLALPLLLLPMGTMAASMAGGILSAILFGIPLKYAAAIGAGCGWYSYTGPVIASYSALYGTVGFLSNLFRELLTIVAYPILKKYVPPEPLVSIGGATTMDTTLGIIREAGGREAGVVAFVHGFVLTMTVPFLVPLLLS